MAESFASVPGVLVFTLGGIDVATQLNFPNGARKVRLVFVTNAGKVATVGTDGGAVDANNYPVTADTDWPLVVDRDSNPQGKGPASIYVASGVGATVVQAICEAT